MIIEVHCPNGHVLHVREKYAGKIGACPHCSAPVRVPIPSQVEAGAAIEQWLAAPPSPVPKSPGDPSRDVLLGEHAEVPSEASSLSLSSSSFALKAKLCLECGKEMSRSFTICPRCGTPLASYRHVEVGREGQTVVVQLSPRQITDEPTVKDVIEELLGVVSRIQNHDLVISMARVQNVSSLMLGKLVMLQKKMQQKGKKLVLIRVRPEVRQVLTVTKLDQLLEVQP